MLDGTVKGDQLTDSQLPPNLDLSLTIFESDIEPQGRNDTPSGLAASNKVEKDKLTQNTASSSSGGTAIEG